MTKKLVCISLLLLISCLGRVSTTSLYAERHMIFKKEALSNHSLLQTGAKSQNNEKWAEHYAVYMSSTPSTALYGAMATFNVYESLNVKKGQTVSAEIWVTNYQGDRQSLNGVQAGWAIEPSIHGDTKPHFTIGWAGNGGTGCFDLRCHGFILVKNAAITPGDIIQGQTLISIKIFKNKDDGNWWLHYGRDGQNFAPVGYWPKSLFSALTHNANMLGWGGYARSRVGDPSPPMGNGKWAGRDSASYQQVMFVDENGMAYFGDVHPEKIDKDCYQITEFRSGNFHYGGPGGCFT